MIGKVHWSGRVTSVQPRIRLLRSFDQSSHSYLGFVLVLRGLVDEKATEFSVALGEKAHEKHRFQVGDLVEGEAVAVGNPELEVAQSISRKSPTTRTWPSCAT
jgi:hypothetical protein